MAFMPLSDEFVTGLQEIDKQHRWLVDLVNQLHDELPNQTENRELVGQILEGLVDYTFNHFIFEEQLFHQYDYPGSVAHKEEHDAFSKKSTELLDKHEEGEDVRPETIEFLTEWLTHHILVVDMAYVPFMKEKGAG